MQITIIGTGFIATTLGRPFSGDGHAVTYGSRHPNDPVPGDPAGRVAAMGEALADPDVVVLALPGTAVGALSAEHGTQLSGRLVVDATNKMGTDVVNARADLPGDVRYARAFNTLGGEVMADPVVGGVRADLFFSAPDQDRATLEELIGAVGLGPVFVGADQEALVDALFRLWVDLAMAQGRGRRLALRLLTD